jgi:polysaccharide biosynthesis/export protein
MKLCESTDATASTGPAKLGGAMLRQIFRTQTAKQTSLPNGRATVQVAIPILICASLFASCASLPNQTAGPSSATSVADNSGYLVGPTDILDISVFKVPELSKSVQVADTGTINLPLVGDVQASGKTASEIERDLTRQLGAKYLKSPQVTVYVKEHNSQKVTIEGSVRKPGMYPIRGTLSLVQLIATAEGVDRDYYSKDVTIFRTVDGKRMSQVYDIDKIREGKANDPQLRQGDLVVVDTSTAKAALQNALKILPAAAIVTGTAAGL